MAKLRRKPKPADPEAPAPPIAPPEPEEEAPPGPAVPPPTIFDEPQEIHPTVVQLAQPIIDPRTPDELVHNVMVRQLADDALVPPAEDQKNPALDLLAKIQERRDRRQPLGDLAGELEALVQGADAEDKVTALVYRNVQNRRLLNVMENNGSLDKLLNRMYRRGDLTPAEAIVFKRMAMTEMCEIVTQLLDAIEKSGSNIDVQSTITSLDHTAKAAADASTKAWEGTTPAGREIIRKVTLMARRKVYETQQSIEQTTTTRTK